MPELKVWPSSEVAVWSYRVVGGSLFFQITVSPTWIETELGVNE